MWELNLQEVRQVRRASPSLSKMALTPGSQRRHGQQQPQRLRQQQQQAGLELQPVANAGASGVQVSRLHNTQWPVRLATMLEMLRCL